MWLYLQGEMGKSGERGREGEPGIKVLTWLSSFILFKPFIHHYLVQHTASILEKFRFNVKCQKQQIALTSKDD